MYVSSIMGILKQHWRNNMILSFVGIRILLFSTYQRKRFNTFETSNNFFDICYISICKCFFEEVNQLLFFHFWQPLCHHSIEVRTGSKYLKKRDTSLYSSYTWTNVFEGIKRQLFSGIVYSWHFHGIFFFQNQSCVDWIILGH